MKWIHAFPDIGCAALHEGYLWRGWGRFSSLISFNEEVALPQIDSNLTIYTRPINAPSKVSHVDMCIKPLRKWVLDISEIKSFDDYLHYLNHKQRYNYFRTETCFEKYGCTLTVIPGDWSEHVGRVFELYSHVAGKYMQIYDIDYFRRVAKLPGHTLVCAWHGTDLIGCLVLVEEGNVLHSTLCGLDYAYSKKSFTYSKLHYTFIRYAIESGKIKMVDSGVTADQPKKTLGFTAKEIAIDISVNGVLFRALVHLFNMFLKVSINENNEVCLRPRLAWDELPTLLAKLDPLRALNLKSK